MLREGDEFKSDREPVPRNSLRWKIMTYNIKDA